MAQYDIPKTIYPPHPAGRFTGTIIKTEDLGMVFNQTYGKEERKICIHIQTDGERRDDGEPWVIRKRFTLSNNVKAGLRKFREQVLDRPLTAEELASPFYDEEIVGKRITYRIEHTEPNPETGAIYGNIREGSVEPVTDNAPQTAPAARQQATGNRQDGPLNNRPVGGATAPQRAAGGPVKVSASQQAEDDLPFSLAFLLPLGGAVIAAASMMS